jgi:hypothetical protein
VISAKPGIARPIDTFGKVTLAVVLAVIGITGIFAARLRGAPGSVALGSLAGLAFGAAAIDSRALAAAHSWHSVTMGPLLYLLIAHGLVGQLLLGMAMQRGSTTAAVAAMDAAATAPAAIIGLALMGDQIWPGREWVAAIGFTVTLASVLGLTRYARPQHATATVSATAQVAPAIHQDDEPTFEIDISSITGVVDPNCRPLNGARGVRATDASVIYGGRART